MTHTATTPHPSPPPPVSYRLITNQALLKLLTDKSPFLTGDVFILGLLAPRLQVRAVLPLRLRSEYTSRETQLVNQCLGIRIGSGFNQVSGSVSGSGFEIRIRIQVGKNDRKK
jgi:hypothetical protein